ncbi:nucleotidyltransferase family protein [Streptomyces sp. DSM 44917]|uniref:Nucleotidyltransferase family protein n=1 Tax=Streptomyces boetiae TaxID=3075541 RepID=A0ABU2L2H7_9ACTN|nr:nucleotidyltransferase family protein [Streptomyces sp. DSM 44917]MDT0305765.1 nucleotidyltransferase family protein [Streptomyces sp. DSM 44917]
MTPRPGTAVAGLLLAAGGGRRLGGRAKALLEHRGTLFVERAARALLVAGCAPVHVVLGAQAEEVRARARLPGCVLVENPGWASGMGSSLRAGLASLEERGAGGALVALVDQPGVGAEAMARVLGAYRSPATLAAAAYGGLRGHPVLLGAAHFAAVREAARGDQGARGYLRGREIALVECGDVASPEDIDAPADLARFLDRP